MVLALPISRMPAEELRRKTMQLHEGASSKLAATRTVVGREPLEGKTRHMAEEQASSLA